jgi:Protein of unknown function (DUF3251)
MKKILIVFFLGFTLIACSKKETHEVVSSTVGMNGNSTSQMELLEQRIKALESINEFNNLLNNIIDKSVFIKVGEKEFQPIRTRVGFITVSIKNIEPFASGSKVHLDFGNPTSAGLKIKFKIDYGSLGKDGLVKKDTEKTKDVSVVDLLKAGSWNKTEVILEGLPNSELGYIRIHDLDSPEIMLYTKP